MCLPAPPMTIFCRLFCRREMVHGLSEATEDDCEVCDEEDEVDDEDGERLNRGSAIAWCVARLPSG